MNKVIICLIITLSSVHAFASFVNEDYDKEYNYADLSQGCHVYDPYARVNRAVFHFNAVLDTFILRPIAKGYGRFTNTYTKHRVESFLNNIREPLSTINYGIQGSGEEALKSFWRFFINSTIGIVGIFDVASHLSLTVEPQTFGNTLAHYGVPPGPYLVIPFLGGSSARDVLDIVVLNDRLNPIFYLTHADFALVTSVVSTIHNRDKKMPFTDHLTKYSVDPYISIRNAQFNARESKMRYPQMFVCPKV